MGKYDTISARGPRESTAKTANYTITADEASGATFTNAGATGIVTFALPAATPGMRLSFHVMAAFELRVDPNGTQTVALPSTGVQSAAGKYIGADAPGEHVNLACYVAGRWDCEGYVGTWTAEP